MAIQGQCMCGDVTVTATPKRASIGTCHCDMCRRWTSSMLMTVEVEPGYSVEGPVKTYTSSDWAERAFCETCGSAIWYRITAPGPMHGQTQMAAGLFDNAADAEVKLELFIDKKPDGYALAGDRRQMTEKEVFDLYAPSEEGDSQ